MKLRTIKRIVLAVVALIVIALLIVYFNLNHIVKRTVEVQGTNSLDLKTTLDSARLSLFGGSLSLNDLQIASPQGYQSPQMLSLDKGSVAVSYGQLRSDPIHIQSLVLNGPKLVIEQSGGKFNIQTLADLKSKFPPGQEPMKLIIDDLQVKNASVVLRPGLPGLDKEMVVQVPSIELKNIGTGEGQQNGAAIKQVAMEVITALAQKSGQANLPQQLQEALKQNVQAITQKVGAEAKKKIEELTKPLGETLKGTDLGGKLDQQLNKAFGSPREEQKK